MKSKAVGEAVALKEYLEIIVFQSFCGLGG
jgi:hypothetical protein